MRRWPHGADDERSRRKLYVVGVREKPSEANASVTAHRADDRHEERHSLSESVERRTRRRRIDWRQGGRAVRKWDGRILVAVALGVGVGMLASGAVTFVAGLGSGLVPSIALWAGMSAVIVYALVRARPAGLLEFRTIDVLWGAGIGLILRVSQGLLFGADHGPFPKIPSVSRAIPSDWWWSEAIPAVLVGPVVEEFLFRAVVLVTVFELFRRRVGPLAAAVTAALVSTTLFVLLHAVYGGVDLRDCLQYALLGVVCGALVLLTGRIWGALLVHITYNCVFIVMMIVGTWLA